MLATLLQFTGSICLVFSFLMKTKYDYGNQVKTIITQKPILKKDVYKIQFEKWIMYIGIVEIVTGYIFVLFRFSPLDELLSNNPVYYLLVTLAILAISVILGIVVTKISIQRFLNFVNSNTSLPPNTAEIYIGNLSGITNNEDSLKLSELESKINLLEEEIYRLKNN